MAKSFTKISSFSWGALFAFFLAFASPATAKAIVPSPESLAYDEWLNSFLGSYTLEKREPYTIVHIDERNPDQRREHLKDAVWERVICPLLDDGCAASSIGDQRESILSSTIWPGSSESLNEVLTLISPFTVDEAEYEMDMVITERLALPAITYLPIESPENDSRELPTIQVAAYFNDDDEHVPATVDDLYRVYFELRYVFRPNEILGTSDHLQNILSYIETVLKNDLRDIYARRQERSADAFDMERLGQYAKWFSREYRAMELLGVPPRIDPLKYYSNQEYRDSVWKLFPNLAEQELARREVNRLIWEEASQIANEQRINISRELQSAIQRVYGIEIERSVYSPEEASKLRLLILTIRDGALIDLYPIGLSLWPTTAVEPEPEPDDDIIILPADEEGRFEVYDPTILLLNPEKLLQELRPRAENKPSYSPFFGYGPDPMRVGIGDRYNDQEYFFVFGEGALIFSESQFSEFVQNFDDEMASSQKVKVGTNRSFDNSVGTIGIVSLAGPLRWGAMGMIGSGGTRTAVTLFSRGYIYHSAGTTFLSAARSVWEGELILPSVDSVAIEPVITGATLASGGAVGAVVRQAVPRIQPLLATTIGMSATGFAAVKIQGGSWTEASASSVKTGVFTLLGGFSDLAALGGAGKYGIRSGVKIYVANASVSAASATTEYYLGGFVDALGYTSLPEAIASELIASFPMDVSGASIASRAARKQSRNQADIVREKKRLARERQEIVEAHNSGKMGDQFKERIRAEHLPKHETIRLHHSGGLMPPDAEVAVVALHGYGASTSQATSMRNVIRLLSSPRKGKYKSDRPLQRIRREGEVFVRVGVDAPDQPGSSGPGPKLENFRTLDDSVEWYRKYLESKRREIGPDKPLIVYARSASPALMSVVNRIYPNLIDGFIFISPTKPGDPAHLQKVSAAVRDLAARGEYELNDPAMNWIENIVGQIDWRNEDFGGKRVLILTGGKDQEVRPEERAFYQGMSEQNSNIEYVDLPNAGHDVLRGESGPAGRDALGALRLIQSFFSNMVSDHAA